MPFWNFRYIIIAIIVYPIIVRKEIIVQITNIIFVNHVYISRAIQANFKIKIYSVYFSVTKLIKRISYSHPYVLK